VDFLKQKYTHQTYSFYTTTRNIKSKEINMKIVTDCAADLSAEELEQLGVIAAPLFINFPEGEINATEISADDFYNRLEAMRPAIPTTAQPSAGIFAELYRKIAETDKDIFSMHISSGLSGTINSAHDGGGQVVADANVSYWDTLSLSAGERLQVMAAALGIKAGWSMDKIQERLIKIRENTEVLYTLDTLEYLARGGRIGRVKALAGALLNLKPVILVDKDGKYSTMGNGRTLTKSMGMIADSMHEKFGNTPVWVTMIHGRFAEKAELLAADLKGKLNIAKMDLVRISPVLGVHTGPHIVGASVLPMELMSDLVG
jgi:DegV family protein with EDD domain